MRKKYLVTYITLGILGLFLITLPLMYYINKPKRVAVHRISYDAKKDYPFEDEQEINNKTDIFGKYEKICASVTSRLEDFPQNYLLFREDLLEVYGAFSKAIGLKMIRDTENTTLYDESGYFSYLQKQNNYIEQNISDLIELKDYLSEYNMKFLYVQAPVKNLNEKDTVTGVIENYEDIDRDTLCTGLSEAGVEVLDIRQYMPKNHQEYLSYFYKTDHHWTPETGIWVSGLISDMLNKEFGFKINTDTYDMQNFQVVNYPSLFLGSQGKKVTMGYCNPEDFHLILPIEETDLHVWMPIFEIDTNGDFSTLINEIQLTENNPYFYKSYDAYKYSDQPIMSITNNTIESNDKILIIGDSYTNVVVPYLSLGCKQVDNIDLRHFTGSFKTYLKENFYDAVIFITRTAGGNPESENHTSLWDFR